MKTPHSFTMDLTPTAQVLDLNKGKLTQQLCPIKAIEGQTYVVTLDSTLNYNGKKTHKAVVFNSTAESSCGWTCVVDTQTPIDITIDSCNTLAASVIDPFTLGIPYITGQAMLTFSPVSLIVTPIDGTFAFTPNDKGDGKIKKGHAIKFVNKNVGSHQYVSFKGLNPFNNIGSGYKFSIPAQGAVFKIAINCGTFDLKHNKFDVDCPDEGATLTSGEIIVNG